MSQNRKKGFTLLELLVVVAIISILSAVTLTAMSSARASGRDGRRVSDIKQIQNAAELYFASLKAYPASIAALTTSNPKFLSTEPKDPKTGASYFYIPLSTNASGAPCTGYHLGASLESSNAVLKTDSDVNSSTIISAVLKCNSAATGPNGGNGVFPALGTAESTAGCDGTVGLKCYDLMK